MPKQTVYIRDEDFEKWKSLKDKSERIHQMLNDIPYTPQPVQPTQSEPTPKPYTPPTEELPCCKQSQPCKHWIWDGLNSRYTNSLSGQVVEVNQ